MSINIDNNVKNQGMAPAIAEGLYANIPAFGQPGRLYLATDTNVMYRDTGSAWVVFLSQVTVPAGLSPIGTAEQLIKVNAGATALEYFTGNYATANTVINTVPYLSATNTFSNSNIYAYTNRIGLGINPGSATSSVSIGIVNANQYALDVSLNGTGYGIIVTHSGTGDPLYIGNGTSLLLNLNTSGVLYNVGKVRMGASPGTTYQLEVDGGVNVATTHDYRKVGVSIFNTTNNNIPKYSTTTATYTNSNLTDSGTLITLASNTTISTGGLGIGTSTLTSNNLRIAKNITGAVNAYSVYQNGSIQSDVTTISAGYYNELNTQATAFTLSTYAHYYATLGTLGSGSAITNQYAFYVSSGITSATNNYGFYSDIASGTNRWNIYINGTANNYINGNLLIGSTTDNASGSKLQVTGNISFQNIFNRKTASYTLVLADQNDIIEMNVATANNLTVPLNSTVAFPIGTEIAITQYGAGKTTIVATGGVTIRSVGGLLSLSAQYAWATLVKVGTDEWYAVGSLIA